MRRNKYIILGVSLVILLNPCVINLSYANDDGVMSYIEQGIASTKVTEQVYWYKQAHEKFPYHLMPYGLLISIYISQAIEKRSSGDLPSALNLLKEVKELDNKLLDILENEPDKFLKENAEWIAETPNFTIEKQIQVMKEKKRNLKMMEKEWKKIK